MDELLLLSGSPIIVNNIGQLIPYTLREIVQIGEEQYYSHLFMAIFDKSSLVNLIPTINLNDIKNVSNYELIIFLSSIDNTFRDNMINGLGFFMREPLYYHENGFFYIERNKKMIIITNDDFTEIQDIIKKQNYISLVEKPYNPINEKARQLIEKKIQIMKKLSDHTKENKLSLSEIISIVSNYANGINIFNIWGLTIYQLYDAYLRLLLWDNYHNKVMLLPYSENDKLEHWASKLSSLSF